MVALKRIETIAIGVIVVLAVIVTSVAVFDLVSSGSNQSTTSLPFVEQPVVDVILPSLFRAQGSGNDNIPLNVTHGQVVTLVVDVYSTVNLNFEMKYDVLTGPTSNSSTDFNSVVVGSFTPETLSIQADGKGTANLTLTFSASAYAGQYNMVVSAVNLENASQFWGDFFQVNVSA